MWIVDDIAGAVDGFADVCKSRGEHDGRPKCAELLIARAQVQIELEIKRPESEPLDARHLSDHSNVVEAKG